MNQGTDSSCTSVFVVDDHPIVRVGVRLMLEDSKGLRFVGEAGTVVETLRQVESLQPDLVVLDLWLGGNDGVGLIRQLRTLAPRTDLVCYTMNDEKVLGPKALRAGAMGYVSKQEPLEILEEAIQAVRRGEKYFSPALRDVLAKQSLEGVDDSLSLLSERELQVLRLIGLAKPNQAIAAELGVSHKTVSAHREALKRKLGLSSSSELVRHAVLWVERGELG
jgi:DNA-binding NarL/FixJ family response regulator